MPNFVIHTVSFSENLALLPTSYFFHAVSGYETVEDMSAVIEQEQRDLESGGKTALPIGKWCDDYCIGVEAVLMIDDDAGITSNVLEIFTFDQFPEREMETMVLKGCLYNPSEWKE